MRSLLRASSVLFICMTLVTGLAYPWLITGLAQAFMPGRANGSLLFQGNRVMGSELIGQSFDEPRYFWGRPSETPDLPYRADSSSGSNLGPSNPKAKKKIEERIEKLQTADKKNKQLIPIDLVTASASGLDPHISPAAAFYQVSRVARLRNRPDEEIRALVESMIEPPTWHIFGEPRVNVLQLNLLLDQKYGRPNSLVK